MKRPVKFQTPSGTPIWINPDMVVSVEPAGPETQAKISLSDKRAVVVAASPQEAVMALMPGDFD
jgi:hypothetical protein